MYCPACGKEVLSNAKFCPGCGQVVGSSVINTPSTIPERNTHPTLTVFIIWVIITILQVFLVSLTAKSANDITGINVIFGIVDFVLFIIFLGTLSRKPKTVISSAVQNISPAGSKNQEKKHSGVGKWVIAIILILVLPAFYIYKNNGPANPAIITAFAFIVLIFLIGIIWRLVKKHREGYLKSFHTILNAIKYLIHHPKLTIFFSLACVVTIFFIYSVVVNISYDNLEKSLPGIQDNLVEVSASKLMGDSIMAGRNVPNMSMSKIAKTTQTTSGNLKQLSASGALKSYKMAAITWNDSVAKAATSSALWKNLPESPPVFTLSLNDRKVNEYIEAGLQKVASLKEAGDIAIKRQDRQTMYYIAGQLLVQEYWLDGIMHSKNPGFLSLRINFIPSAMAWFLGPANRKWLCNSRTVAARCGNANPVDLVNKIRHAAVEYATAQPGADEQWDKITADQLKAPTDQGQYIETQGGVYNGQPNLPPQLSPKEKIFVDGCKAKGGTTGETGGVYARMPTTETGIACHHGNGCWDYLTRSGRNYSGGNSGCPEENILPPPPPPTSTPRPPTRAPTRKPQNPQDPPTTTSWDGEYTTSMSGGCSGQDMSFSSGILPDRFTVRNNRVSTTLGSSAGINSSGYAQISSNVSGFNYVETFQFYSSGGGATVKGSIQLPNLQGINCSMNFSGNRQ